MYDDKPGPHGRPITVKAAVTLTLALLAGLGAGILAFAIHHSEPEAYLAALAASAQALTVFDHIVTANDRSSKP